MGRSRAVSRLADEDPNQSRSKRKRTASTAENLEFSTGQRISDGNGALYHCNYCNKDISGKIRFKCAMCPDFDLCVECFSVGAEVTPHKSIHPYRVMDNLSFPLICPDWNLDEEILLLEGIEMYGLGNWNEVSDHVGTKRKSECIDHYNAIYMNSPCFPLPDLSHVEGKSREELLAMAKEHVEVKKEIPMLGEDTLKEESVSEGFKVEDLSNEDPASRASSSLTAGIGSGLGSNSSKAFIGAVKKASNMSQIKDDREGIKVEESQADRSVGEKKLRTSGDEGPSVTELSGYNVKRQEFEIEYDNDAEQLLADMEFKDIDTDAERELKLRVLRIYSKRLDERKRRKDFILERNLLYPDPFEQNLTTEEREICRRYRVFMRFHSKEEHQELLKSVVDKHRIVKRIQDLKEARTAGCRTSADAERYLEVKRKEAEESARRAKESGQACKFLLRSSNHSKGEIGGSPRGGVRGQPMVVEFGANDLSSRSVDKWDITGFPGADLLSEPEKELCNEMRILPAHYLKMLQKMSMEILNGNITKKSDIHGHLAHLNVEPSKLDRVYDMLVNKGIAQP